MDILWEREKLSQMASDAVWSLRHTATKRVFSLMHLNNVRRCNCIVNAQPILWTISSTKQGIFFSRKRAFILPWDMFSMFVLKWPGPTFYFNSQQICMTEVYFQTKSCRIKSVTMKSSLWSEGKIWQIITSLQDAIIHCHLAT